MEVLATVAGKRLKEDIELPVTIPDKIRRKKLI